MSGHSRQETVLLRYGYPGQGELAKSKVEVFLEAESLGDPSWTGPLYTTQTVTCLEWPTSSPHSHESG